MIVLFPALRRPLAVAALFSAAVNLLLLALPLLSLQVYDRVLTSRSLETLAMLALLALIALGAFALLDMLRLRLLAWAAVCFEESANARLLGCGVLLPPPQRLRATQGLRDVKLLRGVIGGPLPAALFDLPWLPLFVAVLFLFDRWLGSLAVAGAVLLLALAWLEDRLHRTKVHAALGFGREASDFGEAVLRRAETVRALGMIGAVQRRFGELAAASNDLGQQAARGAAWLLAASRFTRQALQVLVLAAGAWLVIEQQLSPGAMIAATILLGRALAPTEALVAHWRSLVEARGALARIGVLLAQSEPARQLALPQARGALAAERLSYAPQRDRVLVKGVSFQLAAGEHLGVVGPSGAGKSTLGRLLLGLVPASTGCVRIDGAELAQWDADRLGAVLGHLPQEVDLFDCTVAENIARLGDAATCGEQIVAAARLARAHELILRLPEGYDTRLGNGGVLLSAGQRQRIGLARALFGAPRVVVLDEPDAFLDEPGQADLHDTLRLLRKLGTTVIVITHRPSLLRGVDRVLVLHEGTQVSFGARDAVLSKIVRAVPQRPATQVVERSA